MLKDALYYPYSKISRLLGFILLFLIPVVNIVTGIMGLGYLIHVFKARNRMTAVLPPFGDHLFKDGFKLLFITLCYYAPVFILYYIPISVVSTIIAPLVALITTYLFPAVVAKLAAQGVGPALRCASIFKVAIDGRYALSWLMSLGLALLYGVITYLLTILTAITIIGPVVVLAVTVCIWVLSVSHIFAGGHSQ